MPYKQLTQFFGSKPNTPLLAHSAVGPSKWEFTAFDVAILYTQVQGGVGREHLNLIPGQTGMSS